MSSSRRSSSQARSSSVVLSGSSASLAGLGSGGPSGSGLDRSARGSSRDSRAALDGRDSSTRASARGADAGRRARSAVAARTSFCAPLPDPHHQPNVASAPNRVPTRGRADMPPIHPYAPHRSSRSPRAFRALLWTTPQARVPSGRTRAFQQLQSFGFSTGPLQEPMPPARLNRPPRPSELMNSQAAAERPPPAQTTRVRAAWGTSPKRDSS